MYYLQSRYYDPNIGRFLNADAFTSTGQGLLGNNMFAYCGNNPVSRLDSTGLSYDEEDGYRTVGAGVQLELDMGSITVGVEIIVYWDDTVCNGQGELIAVYTFSGGSINLMDSNLGAILATVKENINLLTAGTEAAICELINILKGNYSASVSGLLVLGNDKFDSVESYSGGFLSMYGTISHVKGAVAKSSSCVTIGIGATSSKKPSWGLSVTNYTLQGTLSFSNKHSQTASIAM